MGIKRNMVLLPSGYNHKALGDIELIAEAYKDELDVYIVTDRPEGSDHEYVDGIHYVRAKTPMDAYLRCTADYVIDAGAIRGASRFSSSQKRISVWHGIPYKKMYSDIHEKHIVTGLDYATNMDLMVSPSPWYTEKFLRQSMRYKGDVLETALSRTDSLFLDDTQIAELKDTLGVPHDKRIVLYAPTFREAGCVNLPFSPKRLLSALGSDWVLMAKLHYLNDLDDSDGLIDVTGYPIINHILAISDLLITDYSSVLFDYSILGKPVLLYQYDRGQYESDRSFMFEMEDYIDHSWFAFNENDLYDKVKAASAASANAERLRGSFYPHQTEHSTPKLKADLNLDTTPREIHEVIFLVNELNQIGGVHEFVMNLAREFKRLYDAKIIVMGKFEFDRSKDQAFFFDPENIIDIKLSAESNSAMCRAILKSTDGYIISCQLGAHRRFQRFLNGKKAVLMFHGDTKDVVNRNYYRTHLDDYNNGTAKNFRRLVLLTQSNCEVLAENLVEEIREKAVYIENGMDFGDAKSLYSESGDFAFISRLDSDKNPLEAIHIFALSNLNKNYRLHIYGEGKLRQDMEELAESLEIQDRIIFHGYVEDKVELFRNKQGLISTSLTEGMPLTLLEAAKFSVPVYLYDSFTAANDIVSETTGTLIPTGDRGAFVEALNHPFDYARYSNKDVISRFSNETVTKKWASLFKELDCEVESERMPMTAGLSTGSESEKQAGVERESLSRRLKNAIREAPYFQGNLKYEELSVAWRKVKNHSEQVKLPLVSIIMPFYNNGDTIVRAVRSVDKCGYRNYEIVLVNDGSSEDPRPLLKKYKRVRYFFKPNGGLGSARNFGIEHALGKYVLFLDSDDVLYPGSILKLVNYAEKRNLDIVGGRTIRRYLSVGQDEVWYRSIYAKQYVNTIDKRFMIIDDNISTAKLYSKKHLDESGIRFQSGLYEDVLFMAEQYSKVDRIGIIPANVQIWMVYGTGTSISTSLTIDNARERIAKYDLAFEMQTDLMRVYYTSQFIRHTLIASIYPYITYSDSEKHELYDLLRAAMHKREKYILDRLVVVPSKKVAYRALLDGDFEAFDEVARGYSARYYDFHNS